jgi:hypothetical protein
VHGVHLRPRVFEEFLGLLPMFRSCSYSSFLNRNCSPQFEQKAPPWFLVGVLQWGHA